MTGLVVLSECVENQQRNDDCENGFSLGDNPVNKMDFLFLKLSAHQGPQTPRTVESEDCKTRKKHQPKPRISKPWALFSAEVNERTHSQVGQGMEEKHVQKSQSVIRFFVDHAVLQIEWIIDPKKGYRYRNKPCHEFPGEVIGQVVVKYFQDDFHRRRKYPK